MPKLKYYKIFILLVTLILLLFPKRVLAFQEEFNSSPLDSGVWIANQNGGNITISSGFINLSAGNTRNFPFVFSKSNLFPESENFSIKFGIKYNNTTSKGDGIIFSTEVPLNKTEYTRLTDPLFSKRHFLGVWQDSIKGFSLWFCGDCYNSDCSSEEFFVYKKNATDLDYHNIEFKYFSNKYHLSIDDNEVFVSDYTSIKPSYIWLGNPTNQGLGDNWTGFSIDYIKIDSESIPIPTPTPSLTPTPTPTPAPLQPIVLLPGLGASWNHENMILGIEKPQPEWSMTPGIKVYDDLIETLKNAGYETEGDDKNLFIFNYNWTQQVNSTSEELKTYIENVVKPNPDEKIDLIGHSLGGLVARTYVQNNQESPIDQLLTLGSPLQGIPSIYYPWEGGDLSKSLPAWQRIGASLLLHLRKPGFATNMEAVRDIIPSLKDLLPTFNYLKRDSQEIDLDSINQKNDWLIGLNTSLPEYLTSILNPLAGKIPESTSRWINVGSLNWLDKILGLWVDGKPQGEEFADGDGTVLNESATLNGINAVKLENIGHQELVISNEGQQKIMEILNLTPSSISDVSANLDYETALVFQIASPATLEIFDNQGNPVGYGDGKLMIVPNAQSGEYQVDLTATAEGQYNLYIGQITKEKDFWTTVSNSIKENDNLSYFVNFNPSSPLENPLIDQVGETYLETAKIQIRDLKNEINQQNSPPIVKKSILLQIKKLERFLNQNKFERAIISFYQLRIRINLYQHIWKTNSDKNIYLKNKIQEIIENLEEVYIIYETNRRGTYKPQLLKQEIKIAQKMFEKMESKLQKLSQKSIVNPDYGALYLLVQEKLNKAKNSSSFGAHINALGAKFLSQEGLFLFK